MRHLFAALAAAAALTACSDSSGPTDVIPAALAGSWEAAPGCLPNCGFTLVRADNPADSVNFVAGLGATFHLTITPAGGFHLDEILGGIEIEGTVRLGNNELILRDGTGAQDTADYTIEGAYLGLAFRRTTEAFDFDADGTGDPALIRARFRRR